MITIKVYMTDGSIHALKYISRQEFMRELRDAVVIPGAISGSWLITKHIVRFEE